MLEPTSQPQWNQARVKKSHRQMKHREWNINESKLNETKRSEYFTCPYFKVKILFDNFHSVVTAFQSVDAGPELGTYTQNTYTQKMNSTRTRVTSFFHTSVYSFRDCWKRKMSVEKKPTTLYTDCELTWNKRVANQQKYTQVQVNEGKKKQQPWS